MSLYKDLGVDIEKKGIESFKNITNNLYPGAFCVIQKDPYASDIGLVLHTDSAGSKPIMAYIGYKETSDATWFSGLAQDALAMNINDLVCVGAYPVSFVDYVAFNTLIIDRVEMLRALSAGFSNCLSVLEKEESPVLFGGGETADLPDLLKTLDVCVTIFGRVKLTEVITGINIKPGDKIIGVRSGGSIRYEKKINSGIMSNGHTLARSCLMNSEYVKKYPEISYPSKGRYFGRYKFDDYLDELNSTIGEALLSPTRLFSPIALKILKKYRSSVHGIVHNTGGGNTKCLRLGNRIKYIKNMPDHDPIFELIQRESKVEWREMYQDFNMGIGFEFIVSPDIADEIISIIDGFNVGVYIIGDCEESKNGNMLTLRSKKGIFSYD